MRRAQSIAPLTGLACLLGLARDARARETFDVAFQEPTTPSGIAIEPARGTPGCPFDGIVPPPNTPPYLPAGAYRLGTILWDIPQMGIAGGSAQSPKRTRLQDPAGKSA